MKLPTVNRPPVPPWSSSLQAIRLILRGVTFATSSRVSLVVGTILSLVNQGEIIVSGDATTGTWVRVLVNYFVPYVVSSIGYLAPFRVRDR